MAAVGGAVGKIDDRTGGPAVLSDLHEFKLRVDPGNFKLLAHCLIVVVSMVIPGDFTPEIHLAMDKFFQNVAWALAEKYR
ncbi:hypothetical protein ACEWY4_003296 [Coilia grayii]|uniref:Globin domain-containing protein n=1 Tax=Coilia grayii TaxID=363190 RepID=A0ABD1KQV4_9TELE